MRRALYVGPLETLQQQMQYIAHSLLLYMSFLQHTIKGKKINKLIIIEKHRKWYMNQIVKYGM